MLKNHPHKHIIYWLFSGCILIYIMLVVGCLTRLTHSGLSIADWSFMDIIPPFSKEKLQVYFEKYQQSPEFKIINSMMTLDEFGTIFWWEWTHRFIGMLIGMVFMAGFVYFFLSKKFTKKILVRSLVLLLVGSLQGMVGWWMVKSGLVKNPQVSHFRLAIHLITALTAFGFSFWYALDILYNSPEYKMDIESDEGRKLFWPACIAFFALIFQVIYGAFVAGLKAGLYYPTWPKMGNEWFPADVILSSNSLLKDFAENGAGVQFVHRTFAWVLALLIIFIWYKSGTIKLNKTQNKVITWIIYLTTLQIILGIFTLLYSVPVALGALHQTVAFMLFTAFLYLLFHLKMTSGTSFSEN